MHKLIGVTPAQFRTCKAHYLARSVGRPKRRYTGYVKKQHLKVIWILLWHRYPMGEKLSIFLVKKIFIVSGLWGKINGLNPMRKQDLGYPRLTSQWKFLRDPEVSPHPKWFRRLW